MSRQGNPFVRPCPPRTRCRLEEATALRLRARAVTRCACQHAAPDLVRHGGRRAQVPLALKNARKTPQTCGTCARNSTAGLPNDQRLWPRGNGTLRNQYKPVSHHQHIRGVVISISLNISYAATPAPSRVQPITVRNDSDRGRQVAPCDWLANELQTVSVCPWVRSCVLCAPPTAQLGATRWESVCPWVRSCVLCAPPTPTPGPCLVAGWASGLRPRARWVLPASSAPPASRARAGAGVRFPWLRHPRVSFA